MAVQQQAPGITRTDLQQHDLSVPGQEVVQNRVDIGPEAPAVRHKHPGEEIIYVLEGSLEYQVEGRPPTTVEAGEVFFVPAEAIHAVRNVGTGNAVELATYVVEKGKPLVVLADASSWNGVITRLQAEGVPVTAPANPLRGIAFDAAYIASVFAQIDGP